MYRVLDILTPEEVAECRQIAASATFVHGKITNPHNKAKQNEQLHEQAAYQRSAKLVLDAHDCEARSSASSPSRCRSRRLCSPATSPACTMARMPMPLI